MTLLFKAEDRRAPALHEQDRVRRTVPRAVWAGLAAVAVLAAGAAAWGAGVFDVRLAAESVVITQVERAAFAPTIAASGQVVSETSLSVTAAEGGNVATLVRRNGEQVEAGEVIVELRNPALERDVGNELSRIQRDITALEAQLTELDRRVSEAERNLRARAFDYQQARNELDRNTVLEERGFASPARMTRLRDEAEFHERELAIATRQLADARAETGVRRVRLNEAIEALTGLRDQTAARLDALSVRAPASGTISGLTLSTGAPVTAGAVMLRLSGGDVDAIDARVFDTVAGRVVEGASAQLAEAPDARLQVTAIDPEIREGVVRMRLDFDGPAPDGLRAGQSVQVSIAAGPEREAVLAPFGELVGPDTAWVLDPGGRIARPVPVRLGDRAGGEVEILAGLEPGQRVLVSGPRPLDGLARVRITGQIAP